MLSAFTRKLRECVGQNIRPILAKNPRHVIPEVSEVRLVCAVHLDSFGAHGCACYVAERPVEPRERSERRSPTGC